MAGLNVGGIISGALRSIAVKRTVLVIALIYAVWIALYSPALPTSPTRPVNPAAIASFYVSLLIILIITLPVTVFLIGVIISAVGAGGTFVDALDRTARRYLPLLGTTLLYTVIIMLGMFALVIPGIYLMIRLSISQPAAVLENKNPMDALKRSWELTSGNWWSIFAISVAIIIMIIGLNFIFTYIAFKAVGAFVAGLFAYALYAAYVLIFQQLSHKKAEPLKGKKIIVRVPKKG